MDFRFRPAVRIAKNIFHISSIINIGKRWWTGKNDGRDGPHPARALIRGTSLCLPPRMYLRVAASVQVSLRLVVKNNYQCLLNPGVSICIQALSRPLSKYSPGRAEERRNTLISDELMAK